MFKKILIGIFSFTLLVASYQMVCAQEEAVEAPMEAAAEVVSDTAAPADEEVVADENVLYTFGNVVSATSTGIVLKEYDFENDQQIENTYEVTGETIIENFDSLDQLAAEEELEVMFKMDGDKKVALMVSKVVDQDAGDLEAPAAEGTEEMPAPEMPEPPAAE